MSEKQASRAINKINKGKEIEMERCKEKKKQAAGDNHGSYISRKSHSIILSTKRNTRKHNPLWLAIRKISLQCVFLEPLRIQCGQNKLIDLELNPIS